MQKDVDSSAITLTSDDMLQPWESKWLDYGQDLIKNSPTVLNEAAKYLISIVSGVLAIYTGALGYLGISEDKIPAFPTNLVLFIPFILFLISIYFGVLLLNPRLVNFRPDDVKGIKSSFKAISVYKYKIFKCSVFTFILAILSILILLMLLPMITSQGDDKEMITFSVPTENTATFKAMGFTFESGTQVTAPVEKVDDTGTTYVVKINDKKIAFEKDLVTWANY